MGAQKVIIIFCVFFLLVGCKNKVERWYYDSGKLYAEREIFNKHKSYGKSYYENGFLKDEGFLKDDSIPNGFWKEYYSDGTLKWRGEYNDGHMVFWKDERPDYDTVYKRIDLRGNPEKLIVGEKYELRTYVEGIHPDFYQVAVGSSNCKIDQNIKNEDMYPDYIVAKDTGFVYIYLIFPDENDVIIAGKNRYEMKIKAIYE